MPDFSTGLTCPPESWFPSLISSVGDLVRIDDVTSHKIIVRSSRISAILQVGARGRGLDVDPAENLERVNKS